MGLRFCHGFPVTCMRRATTVSEIVVAAGTAALEEAVAAVGCTFLPVRVKQSFPVCIEYVILSADRITDCTLGRLACNPYSLCHL